MSRLQTVRTVRDDGLRFVREDGSGAWFDGALLYREAFDPDRAEFLYYVGKRYGKDVALAVRVHLRKIRRDSRKKRA